MKKQKICIIGDGLAGLTSTCALKNLNIDIDFYESTLICLKYLYPKLSKGGVLVLDNYEFGYGETKAIKKFLSLNKMQNSIFYCLDKKRPVCIIKK